MWSPPTATSFAPALGSTPTSSGGSAGRRQLRGGHVLRVSSAPRRTDRPGRRDAHPAAKAREVLGFYRDFIGSAPDELTTIVVLRMAPPAPSFLRRCTGNRSWSSARATRARWRRASERLPAAAVRRATGGPDPADAVRLTPGAVRSHRAPRARLLLEIGVRAIAQRCPHRHARRAGLGRRDAGVLRSSSTWAAPSVDRIRRDRPSRIGGRPMR